MTVYRSCIHNNTSKKLRYKKNDIEIADSLRPVISIQEWTDPPDIYRFRGLSLCLIPILYYIINYVYIICI